MKITLLTTEQHDQLLSIYEIYPELSLQNTGYEYINKSALTDEAKEAIKSIESILKDAIAGFSSFSNFRLNKAGEIELRIQYNYSYEGGGVPFTGVGYISLNELLNGFTVNQEGE